MSIFWILVIVAVAVAPLISALPNQSQRYEAKIRAHAIQSGVTIKLEPPPEIPPRFRIDRDTALVAYRLRHAKADDRDRNSETAVRVGDVWLTLPNEGVLSGYISELPAGAHIVTLSKHDVTIFWDERGDIDAVNAVVAGLHFFLENPRFE